MRFYLISDNLDTLTGMRLAGINGEVVHTVEDTQRALKKAVDDPDIGIVLITTVLVSSCPEFVTEIQASKATPLIVEIPDRHGRSSSADSLARYVNDAIGISLSDE